MSDSYVDSLLGEHERIQLVTHQHFFMLLKSMAWEIILAIVIIVVVSIITLMNLSPYVPFGYLFLLIPIIGAIGDISVWNTREFIITNRRVIQVEGIFNKEVTDSSLEKVNDVKMEQSFLGRIFNFGDVEILTASELGVNQFRMINNPVGFKTAMLNAKEEMGHGTGEDFINHGPTAVAEVDPRDIPDMIARLDQLRRQGAISEREFQQKKGELLRRIE
jgi:uncharacterized membrane protein YdbT with pleckstrin-like domain